MSKKFNFYALQPLLQACDALQNQVGAGVAQLRIVAEPGEDADSLRVGWLGSENDLVNSANTWALAWGEGQQAMWRSWTINRGVKRSDATRTG